jgi:hypothetical protein
MKDKMADEVFLKIKNRSSRGKVKQLSVISKFFCHRVHREHRGFLGHGLTLFVSMAISNCPEFKTPSLTYK